MITRIVWIIQKWNLIFFVEYGESFDKYSAGQRNSIKIGIP